jgi:Fuc2NAc and GlcNAc transferase
MAIAAFGGSLVLTGLLRSYALRHGLVDRPTERGSHTVPTPRGGGLAIPTVVVAFGVVALAAGLPVRDAAGWLLGGALVALVGFWDDHGHVSILLRVSAHAVAAILGVASLLGQWPEGVAGVVVSGGLVLALVWAVNLYNFMDGSDGLAALQAVIGAGFLTLVLLMEGHQVLGLAALVLASAVAGFLPWNLPAARVFMGDGGSGFLGFALSALIIISAYRTDLALVTLVLPFGYFAFDATVTLLRRIVLGDRVYEPHRKHAYQRALRAGLGHRGVLLGSFALQALLVVLAAGAHFEVIAGGTAAVAGIVLLGVVYGLVERRAPIMAS